MKEKKNITHKKLTTGDKLLYIRRNWQLYVFFLAPALIFTIVFRYLPMGGILMAFEDYNVRLGLLGSDGWGLIILSAFYLHLTLWLIWQIP